MVCTKKDYGAVLTEFLSRTKPEGLISAYLFGSQRTGRTHRESDVDVGILLDRRIRTTRRDRFEERLRLSSALIAALDKNEVDVVVLNDAPPEMAAGVVTEGVRIFCAEPTADRAFSRDVQLRAADLLPFLDRTRRIKLSILKK